MVALSKTQFFKVMAFMLVALIAVQGDYLFSQSDGFQRKFEQAKAAFSSGDYNGAVGILEGLAVEFAGLEGRDVLKGETYLLLGASHEKMQSKDLAVKFYCEAKKILGENRSLEGLDLATLEFYKEPCPEAVAVTEQADVLVVAFADAKTAYFAEKYEIAKNNLEKLVQDLAAVTGRDTLKGEVYLLLGATYEKLKYKELAIKYYCQAKEILGEGKTFEGLVLKKLKYYDKDCPSVVGVVVQKKSGIGRILSFLLGLGLLAVAGYFFYTKVIKKSEEEETVYYEQEYQAWNCWYASAYSNSTTLPTISPANDWYPKPSQANNYDHQSTVSITGPLIYHYEIKLAITACKGLTRRDLVYLDGNPVVDDTNTFTRNCTGTISDFCNNPAVDGKQYVIKTGSGEATHQLRHKIIFTAPSGASIVVHHNATFINR